MATENKKKKKTQEKKVAKKDEKNVEKDKKKASGVVLGVELEELIDHGRIIVRAVDKGGPAAQAGMKAGDEVLSIGDRKVRTLDGVRDLLAERRAGDELQFRVKRGDDELTLTVTLGKG